MSKTGFLAFELLWLQKFRTSSGSHPDGSLEVRDATLLCEFCSLGWDRLYELGRDISLRKSQESGSRVLFYAAHSDIYTHSLCLYIYLYFHSLIRVVSLDILEMEGFTWNPSWSPTQRYLHTGKPVVDFLNFFWCFTKAHELHKHKSMYNITDHKIQNLCDAC